MEGLASQTCRSERQVSGSGVGWNFGIGEKNQLLCYILGRLGVCVCVCVSLALQFRDQIGPKTDYLSMQDLTIMVHVFIHSKHYRHTHTQVTFMLVLISLPEVAFSPSILGLYSIWPPIGVYMPLVPPHSHCFNTLWDFFTLLKRGISLAWKCCFACVCICTS